MGAALIAIAMTGYGKPVWGGHSEPPTNHEAKIGEPGTFKSIQIPSCAIAKERFFSFPKFSQFGARKFSVPYGLDEPFLATSESDSTHNAPTDGWIRNIEIKCDSLLDAYEYNATDSADLIRWSLAGVGDDWSKFKFHAPSSSTLPQGHTRIRNDISAQLPLIRATGVNQLDQHDTSENKCAQNGKRIGVVANPFKTFPPDDYGKVVRGALWLCGMCGFAAYLAYRWKS